MAQEIKNARQIHRFIAKPKPGTTHKDKKEL
jgi:hypothetical protein